MSCPLSITVKLDTLPFSFKKMPQHEFEPTPLKHVTEVEIQIDFKIFCVNRLYYVAVDFIFQQRIHRKIGHCQFHPKNDLQNCKGTPMQTSFSIC